MKLVSITSNSIFSANEWLFTKQKNNSLVIIVH